MHAFADETTGTPAEWKQLRQELETLREERIQASRAEMLFHLMAENVADLLAVIDPEGKRVWNNSAYFSILGYSPEALEGTDSMAEIHPDDQIRIMALFQEALRTGIGHKAEYRMKHFNGRWIPLESKVRVVANEQGVVEYLVLAARDMSDFRKNESELAKTKEIRMVSNFAEGLGHEFHGVLNALGSALSRAATALEKNQTEEAKAHLESGRGASQHARQVLENLFDLGYGKPLEMVDINLENFLTEVAALSLTDQDIQPEFHITPSARQVRGNPLILSCGIKSILDNCVEAVNGKGSVSINVERVTLDLNSRSRLPQLNPGKYVKISISDSGPGIPEDKIERVFEPYFTTKSNRTGLGLTSALNIISRHHGTITVESGVHQKTCFHVFLPSYSPDTSRIPLPPIVRKNEPSTGKKIIFMDDQPLVRKFVGRLLTSMGYDVTLACHGKEVIDLYQQAVASGNRFDAVIMDLLIPNNVGGAAAIHTLRQIDENLVAIASSGYIDQPVMQDPKAFGFTAAIAKPYNRERLSEVLVGAFKSTE